MEDINFKKGVFGGGMVVQRYVVDVHVHRAQHTESMLTHL